ncbi:hypothetical protein NQZ79_g2828 [Umbelopsis isabellina]|nr:hypothetical protein NQZ79_g2828 [Umbelopsis isabellina]
MSAFKFAVLAVAASAATTCLATNITVSTTATNATSLDPSLVSFSIEMDHWADWAGTLQKPNKYTQTLLNNIVARAGQPPSFRVGGDTEDHSVYTPQYPVVNATFPSATNITPWPEATNVSIGREFYSLSGNLPTGTKFTWGINLKSRNVSIAVSEAEALMTAFRSLHTVSLELIEIGNEPDLFPWTSTEDAYIAEWLNVTNAVTEAIHLQEGRKPTLQGAAFAGTKFSMVKLIDSGILTNGSGKYLSTLSQHRYQGTFCYGGGGLIQDLMNKAHIRGNLSQYETDIAATNKAGLDYIFGETNSYSCHGAPGLSNTAGAAVWGIDYSLQAAKLNITRCHFHNGLGYKYNFFQPISGVSDDGVNNTAPHIMPLYHVLVIVGEAIGHTGRSSIQEIAIDDTYTSGYGIYEDNKLVRVILINSQLYLSSDAGARPQTSISLHGLSGSATLKAKRFSIPSADATKGLTWAGQSFETASGIPSGHVVEETVHASSITMNATEVVLLSLH